MGGLLLLQVAEGIGFEDRARSTHRFRNLCRLENNEDVFRLYYLSCRFFSHTHVTQSTLTVYMDVTGGNNYAKSN